MDRSKFARIAAAALLAVAGSGKIISLVFSFDQEANWSYSLLLALVELGLAFGLLSPRPQTVSLSWLSCTWLATLFVVVAVFRESLGRTATCDCLGYFTVDWLPHYSMACIFMLLVLLAFPGREAISKNWPRQLNKTVLAICSTVLFLAALGAEHDARDGLQRILFRPLVVVKEGNRIDAGKVAAGSIGRAEFTVVNRGNRAVRILGTRQSCTCARVKSHPKQLGPGEQQKILVEFDSPPRNGTNTVDVMLYLDLSTQFEVRASLEYEVVGTPVATL